MWLNTKKILLIVVIVLFIITGCFYTVTSNKKGNKSEMETDSMNFITHMDVVIDGKKYIAQIEKNETAQTFVDTLPKEFHMKELNGNEKYIYMDTSLPVNAYNPRHIEAGDIMLYGDNCLVVFYKSFDTSYRYTKIGHMDNLPDLGSEAITIKFVK